MQAADLVSYLHFRRRRSDVKDARSVKTTNDYGTSSQTREGLPDLAPLDARQPHPWVGLRPTGSFSGVPMPNVQHADDTPH
ncbi:hypothetical protein [Mycobacterium tuberculosis]|uniref:hypothetical protein n=1 Tax=Mycobacterium tuberculosis TaxID=1773 RepID=UPI0034CF15C6